LFGSRTDKVVELDSDHDVLWSAADTVADLLLDAATNAP
jgi:hypothetical protein